MTQLAILAAVVGSVAVLAVWWRARDGAVRVVADRFSPAELAELGAPAGRWLLLEFTAPACTPCAATERVLDEVAGDRDGVTVHAVDVSAQLDVVRGHGVLRTPTTFVIDPAGEVRGRVAGTPAADDIAALLGSGSTAERAA